MAKFTFDQLKALWIKAGGDPSKATMAAAVAMAESGGPPYKQADSDEVSSAGARGLWQIMPFHGSISSLDPLTNARGAVQLSNNGRDWKAWDSAYSDNLRGTHGGGYLGAGSMVLKALEANGVNLSGFNPLDPKTWPGVGSIAKGAEQAIGGALGGSLLSLPKEVTDFFTALEKPLQAMLWIVNPTHWARIIAAVFGFLLLGAGLITLMKAA